MKWEEEEEEEEEKENEEETTYAVCVLKLYMGTSTVLHSRMSINTFFILSVSNASVEWTGESYHLS